MSGLGRLSVAGAILLVPLLSVASERSHGVLPRSEVEAPGWTRHQLVRGENLDTVATRYGVTREDLERWNHVPHEKSTALRPGTTLHLRAQRFPPLRQKTVARVREKDSWDRIAERYGVTVEDIRSWNGRLARRKRPKKGQRLVLWVDVGVARPGSGYHGPTVPHFDVAPGGVSIGKPSKGRLQNGVPLPESDLYTIRHGRLAYGTSLAVLTMQRAIATFRWRTGFAGRVVVGAMSRRTGRRLRPHRSHQSGRDVDVRLPVMGFADPLQPPEVSEVDWYATWELIRSFWDTGAVQVIFLERKFFYRLRRIAAEMGSSDQEIARILGRALRHSKGHVAHMHVRFKCSPGADECRD